MWIGDTIYFEADPDGVLNLHALDPKTGQQKQLTRFADYDVGRPSDGTGKIVFDRAGGLEVFDPATGQLKRVAFEVLVDSPETRPYVKNVKDWIDTSERSIKQVVAEIARTNFARGVRDSDASL